MASFKGEYEHSVDNKGRVSFPAKMRKALNPGARDHFIILKGLEHCLDLYPADRWEEVEQHLSNVNPFSRKGRTVKRHFLRSAEDISLDNQNRIPLSPSLKEYAGIDGKAIFLGAGDHIEIWSPDNLAEEEAKISNEDYEQFFEEVMSGNGQN